MGRILPQDGYFAKKSQCVIVRGTEVEVEVKMEETKLGRIEISPAAIAALASEAVLESYGVVGMASRNLIDGISEMLQGDRARRGVVVHQDNERIIIDLYIIVQYGTRISEVAQSVMSRVKFTLEQTLGLPVQEVNVHVQGLRMDGEDQAES